MKFTIITPTLQRESLLDMCQSLNAQTHTDWEHIVQIDSDKIDAELMGKIADPQRHIYCCGKKHNNGGNSCRVLALQKAKGDYIWFGDDDNTLADPFALERMAEALESANKPQWALFPIIRMGGIFYTNPPRSCHVDTMNIVLRWDIAYWPETDAYGTDGILVDDLMARGVPYAAFPSVKPIGLMTKISSCK